MKYLKIYLLVIVSFIAFSTESDANNLLYKDSTKVIVTNSTGEGTGLTMEFTKGKKHSHALIAIWIEDMEGNYIQTLYVSRSIATGIFQHGVKGDRKWEPGVLYRPSTLPYWAHKRNIKTDKGGYIPSPETTVPDAYTGATPLNSFILKTKTDQPLSKFRLLLEINQPFDFNEHWSNNKYPDNEAYMQSGQPAIVYSVSIDTENTETPYYMHPIGHSHYSGADGKLYTNLTTFTTALKIVEKITVKLD